MTTAADDLAKTARSTLEYLTALYNSLAIDGQVGGAVIAELHSALYAYEAARGDGVWVPKEPTPEMQSAMAFYHINHAGPAGDAEMSLARSSYPAMIAAAKGE